MCAEKLDICEPKKKNSFQLKYDRKLFFLSLARWREGKSDTDYARAVFMIPSAFFSRRETWAWEIWISSATSIWVFP